MPAEKEEKPSRERLEGSRAKQYPLLSWAVISTSFWGPCSLNDFDPQATATLATSLLNLEA